VPATVDTVGSVEALLVDFDGLGLLRSHDRLDEALGACLGCAVLRLLEGHLGRELDGCESRRRAGSIGFPGVAQDILEASLESTALQVAETHVELGSACLAAVEGVDSNLADTGATALVAALGALAPGTPSSHAAISRASFGIA